MHAAAMAELGIDGSYVLCDTPPDELPARLASLRGAGFRGVNVTVPHKRAALACCDRVAPLALRVGAVNTLVFSPAGVAGDNTDVAGFIESLRAAAVDPAGLDCLVVGAGGAARAVVVGLLSAGAARVVVTNRTEDRARSLSTELAVLQVPFQSDRLARLAPDLVVNATSLGMRAARGTAAWEQASDFFEALPFGRWGRPMACDLVYNPVRTPFLELAGRHGCAPIDGLGMLARQGALSFQAWTGVPAGRVLPSMLRSLREDHS